MVIRLKLQAMYRYQVPEIGPDGKPIMLDDKPVMKVMKVNLCRSTSPTQKPMLAG